MNKILIVMMALSLTVMPFAVYSQERAASNSPPPVSQKLIPEGDFALKLATALNLGTASNEAQAEDALSSVGIAPKNGWIADYPMTPIIIGELQRAVVAAADARKLSMGRDDALKAFQGVTDEFGLAVVPGGPGQYAENQEAQPDPTVVNNYYYDEGPPVVTYYAPPWDYYYLYDWVPFPFWCSGFFFPGFFVLTDFSFAVFVGGHHHLISSHFIDPVSHAFLRVDPTTRTVGRRFDSSLARTQGFRSPEARKAAGSIFNRSFEGANRTMANSRVNGQGKAFNTPDVAHQRSFGVAPRTNERSFSSPPSRSFNAPQGSSGRFNGSTGGRSFAGSPGGHASSGFSGGGFRGGGGGFGGFHGGGFGGGGGFHGGGGGRR